MKGSQDRPQRPTVFISYNHRNERWKDRLVKHLKLLEPEGVLEPWDDRKIAAGADWLPEIEQAMDRAVAAVLLVSADFLSSGFILDTEVPRLLERRRASGLLVAPVIVEPCYWQKVGWLAAMNCRPRDGRALSRVSKARAEEDLAALVEEIGRLVSANLFPPPPHSPWTALPAEEIVAAGDLADDPQSDPIPSEALVPETSPPVPSGVPAAGDKRRNEIDGTILLYVPGGEYLLGSDSLTDHEKPVHRVVLSPFWIGKYPVTNEQYGQFLRARPQATRPRFWEDPRFNQPDHPVVGVSWEEARAYCHWARLQLPSEAQWEAAARGSDGRRFPWGNKKPSSSRANFGEKRGGTTQVDAFPRGAGPFGTLDHVGNVAEWCEDVWNEDVYKTRERAGPDPVCKEGDPAVRCLRGGSWDAERWQLSPAYRDRYWAAVRHKFIGFRCAMPAQPSFLGPWRMV